MGFTVMGWSESQQATAYTSISGLTDQHVSLNATDFYKVPTQLSKIVGAYGGGHNAATGGLMRRFRANAPSLLSNSVYPVFQPVDQSNALVANPPPFHDLFDTPLTLVPNENLGVDAVETAGTAQQQSIFLWIGDGLNMALNLREAVQLQLIEGSPIVEIQNPQLIVWRATGTTTLSANAWTLATLTADQTLPSGTYAIVGASGGGVSSIIDRLVIKGYAWRPGIIAHTGGTTAGSTGSDAYRFRFGKPGVLGYIDNTVLPDLEEFAVSADTAEEVFLDLLKVA